MTQQRKSWLKRLTKWLLRQIQHLMNWRRRNFRSLQQQEIDHIQINHSSNQTESIQQVFIGNRNQGIAENYGTAIGNIEQYVEQRIQIFHLPSQEINTLESFWENWSLETNPPLSPNLVIGGRDEARDNVLSWLRSDPSPLALQSDSPEEAIAFLAAVIQNLHDDEKALTLSRAIVVYGASSWQNLITSVEPLILIAYLNHPEGIGKAIKNRHHIFVPLGRGGGISAVSLPRIIRNTAEQSLQEMGLNRERASELATLARRSLPALRRKLAVAPEIQQPVWARSREACGLLAPLLVSAWKNSSEGDREALERLSGISYEALQGTLMNWANEADPPIRRVGDVWMISAQEDAWRLIARYLTDDALQRFETVAIDVLSELDPAFELPPEQRYAANVYGKVLTRSGQIREGISETLALIATLSSEIQFTANRTGEQVANRIVWQLLEQAKNNEQLWASLAYLLPLLAEAAPDIFLSAVDEDLRGKSSVLINLFQDKTSDSALMSSSPHTGLLWALETLAWNPDYLSRSALYLARLAQLDPGGRLVNRPMRSLRDIFICWQPNTTASVESRLAILNNICQREPDVAWHLLISLLPKRNSSVSPTHGTKWRDWVPDSRKAVTVQEFFEVTTGILEKLITDAGTDTSRWSSLIAAITGLMPQQQEILLQNLETLDSERFSSKERAELCNYLRHESTRHREHPNAKWAMPLAQVERLDKVYAQLEPAELIDRYHWLFKYGVELLRGSNSWEEQERITEDLRSKALEEIIETQGWEGILQLTQQVQEPALVGHTLAKSDLLPIDLNLFLQSNLGASEPWRSQMVQRFVRVTAYLQGNDWIEECLNTNLGLWHSEQYGEFLLCLPFNELLLDRLDSANEEVQQYFWNCRQDIGLPALAQAERVLKPLLKFNRPHLAVDIVEQAVRQEPEIISPERIAEILEIAVKTPPVKEDDISLFAYRTANLFDYLDKTNLSRERLAALELLYFQVHEHHRLPQELYKELSRNPSLFVEALQFIFRAEEEPSTDISEETKKFAHVAWQLLESWKQMPGVKEDGSVDVEALQVWVTGVRKLAAECSRSKIADIYIGHMLSFSPIDSDGVWPHQAVRDLIEELENTYIESGWRTQIFNSRGATVRLPTDGGQQERILAERYLQDARKLKDRWPRVAAILRDLADYYRRQAEDHDQQAELTQDFWK
jgi:hypothetical protein